MKIDRSKLLGFRLMATENGAGKPSLSAKIGGKEGVKVTVPLGAKVGNKAGFKSGFIVGAKLGGKLGTKGN